MKTISAAGAEHGSSAFAYPNMDAASELKAHEKLIREVANRNAGPGIEVDDLVQEGSIAFVQAISRFDPSRGAALWTYAVRWVRNAMIDYVRRERRRSSAIDSSVVELDELPSGGAAGSVEGELADHEFVLVACRALSKDEHVLIVKRFYDDKDFRQIAEEMGVAVDTAFRAVRSAVESMRKAAA